MLSRETTETKSFVGGTAFRTAEKHYQLHFEQIVRTRRVGKPRHGRLVAKHTDLSAVLHLPANAPCGGDSSPAHSPDEACTGAGLPAGVSCHTGLAGLRGPAYTFAQHPGLVYLPAALSDAEQLQLAHDTLQGHIEPPTKTNHSRDYGLLPGLAQAARLGLRLRTVPPRKSEAAHAPLSPPAPPPEAAPLAVQQGRTTSDGVALHTVGGGSAVETPGGMECAACSDDDDGGGRGDGGGGSSGSASSMDAEGVGSRRPPMGGATVGRQDKGSRAALEEKPVPPDQGAPVAGCSALDDPWSAQGVGPPAAHLLSKLRWATLGPQYDWTARQYDAQGPHRPLPEPLRELAARLAHATAALTQAPAACAQPPAEQAGRSASHPCASEDAPAGPRSWTSSAAREAAPPAAAGVTPSAGAAAAVSSPPCEEEDARGAGGGAGGAAACSTASASAAYLPDAALVSFYAANGALCGHRDDVEPDQDQPIVSLSLGAAAVFLIGFSTRHGCSAECLLAAAPPVGGGGQDAPSDNGCSGARCAGRPPTALLLRSGDVLLLGGAARRCFHGIPRILADHALPAALRPGAVASQYDTTAQYLATSRINISIRAIT